jgi:hypothetical protein
MFGTLWDLLHFVSAGGNLLKKRAMGAILVQKGHTLRSSAYSQDE